VRKPLSHFTAFDLHDASSIHNAPTTRIPAGLQAWADNTCPGKAKIGKETIQVKKMIRTSSESKGRR